MTKLYFKDNIKQIISTKPNILLPLMKTLLLLKLPSIFQFGYSPDNTDSIDSKLQQFNKILQIESINLEEKYQTQKP